MMWADAGGFDPLANLAPSDGVVFKHSGDLKKWDIAALEDVGNLRNGTSGTVREPLAGRLRAITELIERLVVNGGPRGTDSR